MIGLVVVRWNSASAGQARPDGDRDAASTPPDPGHDRVILRMAAGPAADPDASSSHWSDQLKILTASV
jgi:hypothetical protein